MLCDYISNPAQCLLVLLFFVTYPATGASNTSISSPCPSVCRPTLALRWEAEGSRRSAAHLTPPGVLPRDTATATANAATGADSSRQPPLLQQAAAQQQHHDLAAGRACAPQYVGVRGGGSWVGRPVHGRWVVEWVSIYVFFIFIISGSLTDSSESFCCRCVVAVALIPGMLHVRRKCEGYGLRYVSGVAVL